jgi:DNA-binding transcriptional LysR family regulator
VDLRQLRYLVAVVDEGGIRRASRELCLAQPSISQALRRLEGELGVDLIRRTPAGAELTEAGSEFVEYAREILARAANAQEAMRRRAQERSRRLRVGLLAGFIAAGELTAPILERFRQERPDVEVELRDIAVVDQEAPLLSGGLDVALVRAPVIDREIEVVPVALDRRRLLVGATHPLAGESVVHAQDILDFRTVNIAVPEPVRAFWQLDDLRGGPNVDRSMALATTVPELQFAVASGRVITTVVSTVGRAYPNAFVRAIEITGVSPNLIGVAHMRNDHRRVVRDFVDAAVTTAAEKLHLLPGARLPG